jgi:nitroreductase
METWTVIRTKRAVRDYDPRPVPEEVIHRVLQAGRLTGSARNLQPWRFILVREEKGKKALSRCGRFASHLASAAFVVVICTEARHRRWAAFDAGRAAQNMMLAAWDQGVASCVAALHDEKCAREALGIPEDYDIQIAIGFGYPSPAGEGPIHRFIRTKVLRVQGRKPLQELVFYERWGQHSDA